MPLRKSVSILWIPAFMGMTTGWDIRVCNSSISRGSYACCDTLRHGSTFRQAH